MRNERRSQTDARRKVKRLILTVPGPKDVGYDNRSWREPKRPAQLQPSSPIEAHHESLGALARRRGRRTRTQSARVEAQKRGLYRLRGRKRRQGVLIRGRTRRRRAVRPPYGGRLGHR